MALPPAIWNEYVREPTNRARWYGEYEAQSAAATGIQITRTIPIDYDLHGGRIFAEANGGGVQTINFLQIYYNKTGSGSNLQLFTMRSVPLSQVERVFESFGDFIFPAGSTIFFNVSFSAGVSVNLLQAGLYGYLLPRLEFLSG